MSTASAKVVEAENARGKSERDRRVRPERSQVEIIPAYLAGRLRIRRETCGRRRGTVTADLRSGDRPTTGKSFERREARRGRFTLAATMSREVFEILARRECPDRS